MEHRYLKNVSTLKLDTDKCTGCGMCTQVCPHAVFEMGDKKVRIADKDRCMGCGACAMNCPSAALSVQAGVGCAAAIIQGLLTGKEPSCGGGGEACCG
jgi:NAD-dependent dihydropyrimidine dehydrogenase PreA subunit